MSRLMIIVEFEVKPEHRDAFVELMKGHARPQHARDEFRRQVAVISEVALLQLLPPGKAQ